VHELVRGHLDRPARDLGLLRLKNIERPVHAFMIEPDAPGLAVPALAGQHSLPSIAVRPLQNLSNDPAEDYFGEGIVEDIVTSLASLRELFVISRNSTLGLARANVDLREIGRALGVRYVLTGSVRRSTRRVRVNVQLADSGSGVQLWPKASTPRSPSCSSSRTMWSRQSFPGSRRISRARNCAAPCANARTASLPTI
jgi:adenylate cyclase